VANAIALWEKRPVRLFDYRTFVLLLISGFVGLLAVVPLFYLLWNSFKPVGVGNLSDFSLSNFTLQNFVRAYSDPGIFTMLLDSFFLRQRVHDRSLPLWRHYCVLGGADQCANEKSRLRIHVRPIDHAQHAEGHRLGPAPEP